MKPCYCGCSSRKVKRGLWSPDEDDKLRDFINKHGIKCWSQVPIEAELERCGKSCRLRWLNYLRPGLKRGNFTIHEQELIFELQAIFGNRWSWIARRIPGRTDNEIKNFWNVCKSRQRNHNFVAPCSTLNAHISSFKMAVPSGTNMDGQFAANAQLCSPQVVDRIGQCSSSSQDSSFGEILPTYAGEFSKANEPMDGWMEDMLPEVDDVEKFDWSQIMQSIDRQQPCYL